jgi:hypothetical protein
MVHFFIGFNFIPLIIEIVLLILLIFIIKNYERRNEIKLSLFHWIIVVVIYLVITSIILSVFL